MIGPDRNCGGAGAWGYTFTSVIYYFTLGLIPETFVSFIN